MAERDKAQGFGFVYVDIRKLLDEARAAGETKSPVASENVEGAHVLHFPKPEAALVPVRPQSMQNETAALKQIRENLDRLQALHRKLHAVLAELSDATDRKKS